MELLILTAVTAVIFIYVGVTVNKTGKNDLQDIGRDQDVDRT